MTRPDSFQAFLEGYGIDIIDFRFMCGDSGKSILDKAALGNKSHGIRIVSLFIFDENNFFDDTATWFRINVAWLQCLKEFDDIPFFTSDDLYVDKNDIFYKEIRAKLILTFNEEMI